MLGWHRTTPLCKESRRAQRRQSYGWCDHDHEHTSSGSSGMSMEELDQDLMKAGQDAEEKESLCRLRTFHGVADHEALGKEWLGLR